MGMTYRCAIVAIAPLAALALSGCYTTAYNQAFAACDNLAGACYQSCELAGLSEYEASECRANCEADANICFDSAYSDPQYGAISGYDAGYAGYSGPWYGQYGRWQPGGGYLFSYGYSDPVLSTSSRNRRVSRNPRRFRNAQGEAVPSDNAAQSGASNAGDGVNAGEQGSRQQRRVRQRERVERSSGEASGTAAQSAGSELPRRARPQRDGRNQARKPNRSPKRKYRGGGGARSDSLDGAQKQRK